MEFLIENVHLISLILEAKIKIKKIFPESKLILEVKSDPKMDNNKELIIFIQTNIVPEEAFEKLMKLDEEWWLEALNKAYKGKLCVHLEFK